MPATRPRAGCPRMPRRATCALVRFDRSKPRRCNPDFAGDSGAHTLFADGYPVLVIGSASLDRSQRAARRARPARAADEPLPARTSCVDGLAPYDEDHVDTLDRRRRRAAGAGEAVHALPGDDHRPGDAARGRRAAAHARGRIATTTRLAGVTFGMNAIVARRGGALAAGAARRRVDAVLAAPAQRPRRRAHHRTERPPARSLPASTSTDRHCISSCSSTSVV